MGNKYGKRAWAEIDISKAKHNFFKVKSLLKSGVKLCCVVKADCYGHSAKILAPLYQKWGADYFAVSSLKEGIELRKINIHKPILILGYTEPKTAYLLEKYNLSQTVYSKEYADLLLFYCEKFKIKIKVHIKIDTGMGRLGFVCNNTFNLSPLIEICKNSSFILEGIFTHFSRSDLGKKGKAYTTKQYLNFMHAISYLKQKGITFPICHASNSGGIVDYKNFQLDMCRAGLILYGLCFNKKVKSLFDLKPIMSFKCVVASTKSVKFNDKISYGGKRAGFKTKKIAVLPFGYADGFWRSNFKKKYKVLLNNTLCKIVGKVCMDQTIIDITKANAKIGDTVLIFGDNKNCNATKLSKLHKTINYEIVCNLGKRICRIAIYNKEKNL